MENKDMKAKVTIILFFTLTNLFAQPSTGDDYIQNFYVTCKPNKYSAFNDIQVGIQLLDTKQYYRSINRFSKALIRDSTCTDPYFMLAFCYQRTGELEKAISYADSSIFFNSTSLSAWIIKGTTLLMKNDLQKGENCFRKAIEIAPDILDGYYGLALSYYKQNRLSESLETILKFESLGITPTEIRDGKKMKKLKKLLTE